MLRWTWILACALPVVASAAPMQLFQQGRVVDDVGDPLNGPKNITVSIVDGGDSVRHTELFSALPIADGYFSVHLGAGSTTLDTAVFLDYGAMDVEVSIDGTTLSSVPAGGYPFVVAQQALLAREATAQQIVTDIAAMETGCAEGPAYSESCSDWATLGWSSLESCREDGRWHIYGTTDGTWDSPQGYLDWVDIAEQGADTKVRLGIDWYHVVVRHRDESSGRYMFVTDIGSRHVSFRLTNDGDMVSVHATTSNTNSSFNDAFWDNANGDLGNRHHITSGYSYRSSGVDIDESRDGGISVWARR